MTIIVIEQNCIRGRWINEYTAKYISNGQISKTEIISWGEAKQIRETHGVTRIGHKRAWFAQVAE